MKAAIFFSMIVATVGLIVQSYFLLVGPLIVNATLAAWTWSR